MIPLNENSLVTRLVCFWFNTAAQRCGQLGQHEQACDRGDDHNFKRHPAIIIQDPPGDFIGDHQTEEKQPPAQGQ